MSNDQARRYYNSFSGGYERERHKGYHRWLDEQSVSIVAPLAENARVLEVGCGTGLILKEVAPLAEYAVGLDISAGMLEYARARQLNVIQSSATAIPFPDNYFDLIYSFKVLAHVPDISLALMEMTRVLKPGGRLALEFYNKRSLRYLIRRVRPSLEVGVDTDESQIFTRFDDLADLKAQLPPNLSFTGTAGLRVATLLPQVFKVPGVGRMWAGFENLLSTSPLRVFGGFLVVLAQKQS